MHDPRPYQFERLKKIAYIKQSAQKSKTRDTISAYYDTVPRILP